MFYSYSTYANTSTSTSTSTVPCSIKQQSLANRHISDLQVRYPCNSRDQTDGTKGFEAKPKGIVRHQQALQHHQVKNAKKPRKTAKTSSADEAALTLTRPSIALIAYQLTTELEFSAKSALIEGIHRRELPLITAIGAHRSRASI